MTDQTSLIDAMETLAGRRGLQPRRAVLRRRLVDGADLDRRRRRAGRHPHARGDPPREAGGALLPGRHLRDVRQGARGPAVRDHAVPPALALRRRQGVRLLHHAELPRVLRHARLQRHPLQPRVAASRPRVRDPQDHQPGGQDQAGEPRSCAWATSTPSATGASPATTSR